MHMAGRYLLPSEDKIPGGAGILRHGAAEASDAEGCHDDGALLK